MNNAIFKIYFVILLLMPSLAYAHNFGLMFEWVGVILYAVITLVYGGIIYLLRWKLLFKHLWVVLLSLMISMALMLVGFVALNDCFSKYIEPRYLPELKDGFMPIFIIFSLCMVAIIWLFHIPIKQYQQLADKMNEITNSIDEALGIKNKEG